MREDRPTTKSRGVDRRPLRVCHLAYSFYENDNRVIRYAEALAADGSHVDVLALRRDDQPRVGRLNGVNIVRLQPRAVDERRPLDYLLKLLLFLGRAALVLSWRHVRKPYDIIHVHNVPDFLVFAAALPRLFGARIILDIHDILPELYAGKFNGGTTSRLFRMLLIVERLSCRFADHVIVANHLWHGRLATRTGTERNCTTILNYPDLNLFAPSDRRSKDDRFIALYPGTLNSHQGVDLAVRAFGLVAARMPGAEFHIYGEGPMKAALGSLILNLGLSPQVRLMDRVPLAQVPEVMSRASVGIVPKRADGFGNEAFSTKILEFMACGVPVIVSRTRVDAHYFDERTVRFFPSGDVDALAAALLWTYDHRGTHGEWIAAARSFATTMSWQSRAGDYYEIIDRLTGRASRPGVGDMPLERGTFHAR